MAAKGHKDFKENLGVLCVLSWLFFPKERKPFTTEATEEAGGHRANLREPPTDLRDLCG
jgi:hypothetical protein